MYNDLRDEINSIFTFAQEPNDPADADKGQEYYDSLCDPAQLICDPYDNCAPPEERVGSAAHPEEQNITAEDDLSFDEAYEELLAVNEKKRQAQAEEQAKPDPYTAFAEKFAEDFSEHGSAYAEEQAYKRLGKAVPSDGKQQKNGLSAVTLPQRPLEVFNCEQLAQRMFGRREFLVSGFLTTGLTVLAGSPKVGKSWLVLQLCMQIATGQPFLGLPTKQSGVLYIALEDDERRLQRRMYTITEEQPQNFYMTTRCSKIADDEEFEKELTLFFVEHKDVRLIVIDTFQKMRAQGRELSYANDYSEVSLIKNIADTLNIAIVLVHHTRKQGDSDYMNEISGTNGIAGSADTLMVLKKEKRSSREATLSCTGRDIEDREMTLRMERETCIWEKTGDNCDTTDEIPEEIREVAAFMKKQGSFEGANAEFAAAFTREQNYIINASHLKRAMNRYRYELADLGVTFEDYRTNNRRMIKAVYRERGLA